MSKITKQDMDEQQRRQGDNEEAATKKLYEIIDILNSFDRSERERIVRALAAFFEVPS